MAKTEALFKEQYQRLNKLQKEAVDSIDGPVMVVAGPGTGKTQILALRIGNILEKGGTEADGILCLTFTNAGVYAMKKRLRAYIGPESSKVHISTFHSFGMQIVEEHYALLDFISPPQLLDEKDSVALCDQILENNDWRYIRPRGDSSKYFRDLKSLISLLKRERLTPLFFRDEIKKEIKNLSDSPDSLSSRGETKGELKKDIIKKIEGLERTLEVVTFYELYEQNKKEGNFLDYDDILESLVQIVESSEDVRATIKEQYLYVLIDEHQDSSGVQNEFLKIVWGDVDLPNIFVVGDDRQLIYGFGGASLAYFEGFKHSFGKAKLITLIDNYRSTQVILDISHSLLASKVTPLKLKSQSKETHPIRLVEAEYPRDEIIACGLEIKEKIKKGLDPNEIAVLVPKNRQVRTTIAILSDMGIPISANTSMNFFDKEETVALLRILKIIANPYDSVALSESLFDKFSNIPMLLAHKYARENVLKKISLEIEDKKVSLFVTDSPVILWLDKLRGWLEDAQALSVYSLVQKVADDFLLKTAGNHQELVERVEVVRTFLHLALSQTEKNPKFTLQNFIDFLARLESYGTHLPLAVFAKDEGVKVLTLHGSKGLEFEAVFIAHMDEKSLMSSKKQGFVLPEFIAGKIEKKDNETAKRELYVAITRAKRFCTISYALHSHTGGDLELAQIIRDLPEEIFSKQTANETEKIILAHDPKLYIEKKENISESVGLKELTKLVSGEYEERKVSVSLLNNFFECTWKWYFRNLLQLPEVKSESLEVGNKVHKAIDHILKLNKKPSISELASLVEGDKDALSIVSKWAENRLMEISKNRENEQSVSVIDTKFPHLNIYGKIDLIEKLDKENVRVTDFKTGSAKKKSEIEKINEEGRMSNLMRQLAMYSYLLESSPKWKVDVRESRLEFLEAKDMKDIFYNTVIQKEQIILLVKDIQDYDHLLKTGEWVSRPCNYNAYGKNTECQYCKMALMYK